MLSVSFRLLRVEAWSVGEMVFVVGSMTSAPNCFAASTASLLQIKRILKY